MVVDKNIINLELTPLVRGVYFLMAEKTDRNGILFLQYDKVKNLISKDAYAKAIKELELSGLINKKYKYFKLKSGNISKINQFHLNIYNPVEIPFEMVKKTKHLNLKEKGILYTLYLMKSKDNYIFSTIRELSNKFNTSYPTFSLYIRLLEELGFIKREKFRLEILEIGGK